MANTSSRRPTTVGDTPLPWTVTGAAADSRRMSLSFSQQNSILASARAASSRLYARLRSSRGKPARQSWNV